MEKTKTKIVLKLFWFVIQVQVIALTMVSKQYLVFDTSQ